MLELNQTWLFSWFSYPIYSQPHLRNLKNNNSQYEPVKYESNSRHKYDRQTDYSLNIIVIFR